MIMHYMQDGIRQLVVCIEKEFLKKSPRCKFIGGKGEDDDFSYEDTAAREVREETGLCLNKERLKYVFHKDIRFPKSHTVYFFECEITLEEAIQIPEESKEVVILRQSLVMFLQNPAKAVKRHYEAAMKFKDKYLKTKGVLVEI